MMDNNKVINLDFEGWPIEKMSIRDIIGHLGFIKDNKTNTWTIKDEKILDLYPVLLEPDGMGYGVNEQYITEVNVYHDDKPSCIMFREKELPGCDLFLKLHVYPGGLINYADKIWNLIGISNKKSEDDQVMFELEEWIWSDNGQIHTDNIITVTYSELEKILKEQQYDNE